MIVGRVAPWTRSAGATARAGALTFPRSIGMFLADPAAILAEIAFHRSPLLPRITLTADLAMPHGPKGGMVRPGACWGLRRASGRPVEIRTDVGAFLAASLARERRILPHAVTERFETSSSGALIAVVANSTKPTTTRVTHAGIATVIQYDLRMP